MDILSYINRMNQIYGNEPAPAPRYNTQQYLQGGRVGMKPGGLVEPGVTHYGTTKKSALQTADTNKVINRAAEAYNKSILGNLKTGDLSKSKKFLEWARNNYNKETYTRIKSRYNRSVLLPTHPLVKPLEVTPYNLQTMKKNLLETLVDQANNGNRYVTKGALLKKVSTTGRLKVENPYEEIIDRLHKPKDKVHLAIDTLLKEPLFLEKSFQLPPGRREIGYIYKNLMQETGLGDHYIKKYIKSHEKFKKIGANETTKLLNFIQRSIAQKGPDRIKGWTLDELLEWGISRQGGRGRLTGLGKFGFLQLSKSPEMAAWNFVSRSFYNNAYWGDKGPIEFFDENNKRLTFNDKINVKDHYFTYEGKKYGMGDIDRELGNWEKGKSSPFKEVFSNHRKMNEFLNKDVTSRVKANKELSKIFYRDVPHPTKKSATITMKELMQKAYGDRSIYMSLDHGSGVTKYPLKNIKVLGHRMNTSLGRVYKHYNDFPEIRKLLTDEIMSDFKGKTNANYLKALEKKEYDTASKILINKNSTIPSVYSEASKNVFASKNYKNFNLKEKTKLAISIVPKEAQHKIRQPVFQSILEKDISGKQALKELMEELGCGKATGNRVGFQGGGNCLEKGKKKMDELLIKGTGTQAERGMIARILTGAGKFLSPKELIRPGNLFGPAALSIYAAIEAGAISHDVINKGTPIKEALGANWMTKWAMPKTLMEYQIQDLRKTGNLDSPLLKNFAQTTEQMAELDRLYNVLEINKAGGISTADTEKQIKELQDEITSTMKKNNMTLASFEPGSAAMIEFQNKLTEKEARQLASTKESKVSDLMRTGTLDMGNLKDPYKPMFGFDELKPKENIFRVDPKKGRMSGVKTIKGYTLPTYKNMTEEPVTKEETVYEQKRYGLKPEQRIEDYTDTETGVNLAKALELKKKWTQALYQPGMRGTQADYSTGGRVSFKFGGKGVDKGRRAFMKLLAALGIGTAGAKSGISLFGKAVGKKAAVKTGVDIVSSTPGMPSWFPALVNKIIKEGDDVTAKLATQERQVVHTKKIDTGSASPDEVTIYRDLDTGDIRVEVDSVSNMGEAPIQLDYKAPSVIDSGKMKGKKTTPEFSAVESEPRVVNRDGDIEFDGENVVGSVDDLFSDTTKVKNYAKGEKPTMKDIVTRKKKTDIVEEIHERPGEHINNKYGDGPDLDYDDYLPEIDDID